jgi:uncharacterized membrane protein
MKKILIAIGGLLLVVASISFVSAIALFVRDTVKNICQSKNEDAVV